MRFISLGLLLILTLEGVVPTRQDESPLRIRSNTYPWGSTEGKSRDEFLDPLLDQLTVEELAQQLSLVTGASVLDQGGKPTLYNSTGGRGIGEINFWVPPNVENFNAVQKLQIENARVPLPILLTAECLHGLKAANTTIFPENNNLANTFDYDLIHRIGAAIALETRGRGIHGCYSPVLDLAKDPRWGRIGENFGEDKFLTARLAVAYVTGLQNNGDLTSLNSSFASIKHYLAHGSPEGGRNIAPVKAGPRQVWTEYALPFRDAIELGGAKGVMMAYHTIDGMPAVWDPLLYRKLRDDWGFDGRVISDDHDIYRAYTWSQAAPTPQSAIAKWLNAGGSTNYADWSTTQWNEYVVDAVNTSMVSLDTLKLRVKEQLAVKYDLGLFDNPYYPENFTQGKVDRQSTADLASEAGSKSIVMLKNDGILPMDKDQPPKSPLLDHLVTRTRSSETLRQGLMSYAPGLATAWGATAFLDYRAEIIPMSAFRPSRDSDASGLRVTYYHDINFANVAYVIDNDAAHLEWDVTPPVNGPGGVQLLSNNSFSARWEGVLISPTTVYAALGANTNTGWAALYVNGTLVANATSGSVFSSYGDGATGNWSYWENNSTNIPPGLAPFDFIAGEMYDIRLDFVAGGGTGLVHAAWNLVDRNDGVQNAVDAAKDKDVIVLAVGYDPESDSETNDIADITLPANQTILTDAIYALGKQVILVLFGPRPKAISEYYLKAAAVLHAGYPGQSGGQNIADIIYGLRNPSGKLSVTVPYDRAAIPAYYNHEGTDYRYWYRELSQRTLQGDLVPYGVFGAGNLYNPAYHFGYGLSYTSFAYSALSCDKTSFGPKDTINFYFEVQNIGEMAGRDVPQLYLLWRVATIAQPRLQLYGFDSVELQPGEFKAVTIAVDVDRYLTSFNDKMQWGVDAYTNGTFVFALMPHSGGPQTNNVTLTYIC